MKKLKEKVLLNYLKKLGAKEINRVNKNKYWDIHYTFMFNDLKFSIISYNQFCKKQMNYFKERKMEQLIEKPIWEIYCFGIDNDVERSWDLKDFNNFIVDCIKLKEKNENE